MVRDTPPSQDVSTHQIWNSYLKEYRRYGPDTKAGRTDWRTDGLTDGRTDSAITICLPKFLWGHKNVTNQVISCWPSYRSEVSCIGPRLWPLANTADLGLSLGQYKIIWLKHNIIVFWNWYISHDLLCSNFNSWSKNCRGLQNEIAVR